MLYKPGGPTTFFGGNGLGPFDGDLSMVKKMAIMRDGVDRENWMWAASVKVLEWNEEWTRARKERWGGISVHEREGEKESSGGAAIPAPFPPPPPSLPHVFQRSTPGPVPPSLPPAPLLAPTPTPVPTPVPGPVNGVSAAPAAAPDDEEKKAKLRLIQSRPQGPRHPIGVYEPHTGLIHCTFASQISLSHSRLILHPSYIIDRTDTQPTNATWEVKSSASHLPLLAGSRVGAGAWGIAYVDNVVDYQPFNEKKKHEEMMRLVRDAETWEAKRVERERERERGVIV